MDWATWEPWYEQILADFCYDRAADEAARDQLSLLLADRPRVPLAALAPALAGRTVWIIGAAATAADVARIPRQAPVLAADAAARVTLAARRPTAIVTDLDGDVEEQIGANAQGVPLVVHAHGDNRPALESIVPRLAGPVVGSTQAHATGRIESFGGFTDGDRACCLAAHLGADSLVLVGFDFESPAPKAGLNPDVKRRKLAWARRIVDALPISWRAA